MVQETEIHKRRRASAEPLNENDFLCLSANGLGADSASDQGHGELCTLSDFG